MKIKIYHEKRNRRHSTEKEQQNICKFTIYELQIYYLFFVTPLSIIIVIAIEFLLNIISWFRKRSCGNSFLLFVCKVWQFLFLLLSCIFDYKANKHKSLKKKEQQVTSKRNEQLKLRDTQSRAYFGIHYHDVDDFWQKEITLRWWVDKNQHAISLFNFWKKTAQRKCEKKPNQHQPQLKHHHHHHHQ